MMTYSNIFTTVYKHYSIQLAYMVEMSNSVSIFALLPAGPTGPTYLLFSTYTVDTIVLGTHSLRVPSYLPNQVCLLFIPVPDAVTDAPWALHLSPCLSRFLG